MHFIHGADNDVQGGLLPNSQTFECIHPELRVRNRFILPGMIWAVEVVAEFLQWKKQYYEQYRIILLQAQDLLNMCWM